LYVAASGLGEPAGGIDAERSLRTTFSQSSGLVAGWEASAGSMTSPAVFSRALWHVTQYWVKTAAGVWAERVRGNNKKSKPINIQDVVIEQGGLFPSS
jgi:hypothetical protein